MRIRTSPTVVVAMLTLFLAAPLRAQDRSFSFSIAPYAWFTGIDGTIGARGLESDVDQCFSEIFDEANEVFGIFARAELHYGEFGFFVDGGYMKIVGDFTAADGRGATATNEIGIIDFGLMYRFLEIPKGATGQNATFALDATVGGRYWTMGLDIEPDDNNFPSQSGGQAWIDPTVGLRGTISLGEHWQILLGGDVGGFGAASDFTWSAVGTVGYVFAIGKVQSSVFAGYKAIGDDYTNGSGDQKFVWDATLSGPLIGMSFAF